MDSRPEPSEHIPYYGNYIALVPEGDVLAVFESQLADLSALVAAVPEEQAGHRYAPGKWSIRGVLGHLVDVERVLAYRALCIARGETAPLNGFEPEDYARESGAESASLRQLAEEFEHVRRGNLAMLRRLQPAAWLRKGTADGNPISVRALVYVMAGHVPHHLGILRDRYGVKLGRRS
jgi:hypothetical protein